MIDNTATASTAALTPGAVVVVGIPFDEYSSFMRGPAKAPAAIRHTLHNGASNLFAENGVNLDGHPMFHDLGDLTLPGGEAAFAAIGAAIEIHKVVGPGLLESAYENALAFELRELGFEVKQQVPMPFVYKDVKQDVGYRIDLVIDDKILVEVKSVETLAPVQYAQTLTYLKLSDLKLGLLINFNTSVLKDGIHRIVNNL